jgi:hypothetical protein
MRVLPLRLESVAHELQELWEDSWQRQIGPRVVVLKAPLGWGRSRVLGRVAEIIESADAAPFTMVISIPGRGLPDTKGLQAQQIRDWLSGDPGRHRAAELLDVDRPGGQLQLALEVGGLVLGAFATGPAVGPGVLLADRLTGVLRKLWDDSAAGQAEVVARAARVVSTASAQAPVVVLIDDAERLDVDLAVALLENLTFRADGQLLAVLAADGDSDLAKLLRKGDRPALARMVQAIKPDPDMGYAARASLAREQCPGLPEPAIRRIGQRTRTFREVLKVTASGRGRLAEIGPADDQPDVLAVVDAVIDSTLDEERKAPSDEAVMVAWAGGLVHARQAAAALAAVGKESLDGDPDLAQSGPLVRLADPGPSRFGAPVIALERPDRHAMGAAVLEEAAGICADKLSGLVDRVVAGRAAHQVRGDLSEDAAVRLLQVQRALTADLEAAGDLASAAQIAAEALKGCPHRNRYERDRRELEATVLRLAGAQSAGERDRLVAELIGEAISGGAAIGLEARVWAAVNLLGMPGRSEAALALIDRVTAELDSRSGLGESEVSWRLQLASRAGIAGYLSAAQPLLAPLLTSPDAAVQDVAARVQRAISDPYADTRLQIETLEAELRAARSDDDLLRLHAALASAYGKVGKYGRALEHAQIEVQLRQRLQGPEHPATLIARHQLAMYTGQAGNPAAARDQYSALLPDMERVRGPKHPDTLTTRGNLALWTGEAGDPAGALRLFAELLPIRDRVFGPDHPYTLNSRRNLAYWTGQAGNPAAARDLFAGLLPVEKRVLGPDHPDTLITRRHLANMIGQAGNPAAARDLLAGLLPDTERVLGPAHLYTRIARNAFYSWARQAESGGR